MDSTHKSVGKYDMLLQHDQAVILTEQPNGEKCRAQIVIPKRIFRQLLEWYETEQPNDKLKCGAENQPASGAETPRQGQGRGNRPPADPRRNGGRNLVNKAAQALGRLARGVPKNYSVEEIARRSKILAGINDRKRAKAKKRRMPNS